MRLIYAVLPLLALAGCSSYQADSDKVTDIPTERLRAYQEPVQGGGEVVVTREFGADGWRLLRGRAGRSQARGAHRGR